MLGRAAADNLHPLFCRTDSDVWLYPKGYLPFVFKPSVPCAGIIHDTILLWYYDHYRKTRPALDYAYWLGMMKRSLARFDVILTISQSAKKQILEMCERFSISPPHIEITYESVRFDANDILYQKGDYVVHISSLLPHKKSAWLIENWIKAAQSGLDLPLLKIIGSVPSSVLSLVKGSIFVEKLPFLDDVAYKQTLGKARALIMSSEIEGFGLPAVEAYCLGTPACYVRGTAVEEVIGVTDRVGAFDLNDPRSLYFAVNEVLSLSRKSVEATRLRLQQEYSVEVFGQRVIKSLNRLAG
jgi:glycosyltransferase involved in cell wall biosynthesis